jgi:LPXTG-site transpeptidase (sortase) family protein
MHTTTSSTRPVVPGPRLRPLTRLLGLLAAAVMVWVGCSTSTSSTSAEQASIDAAALGEIQVTTTVSPRTTTAPGSASDSDSVTDQPNLSALVQELPPAPIGFPPPDRATPQNQPVSLDIPAIGVTGGPVIAVGVEPNGEMEVPPADEVGWYRFGPTPGQAGATVLAAHVAFDGRNGIFVRLDELSPGDEVTVGLADGTTATYVVETTRQFPKDGLPDDELFAREGPETLVLITCGGRFDTDARSYEDNIVVTATPLAAAR